MSVKPYVPDPETDVFMNSYDNEIPLACNVIYYVESAENEPLNAAMRDLAKQDVTLLDDAKIQPYPFRLQYVAQSDLDKETLRAALIPEYGETLSEETVGNFRRCLSDGQGGTLVARCLPTFSRGDFFEDDNTVCTFPGFRLTAPENAAGKVAWFAQKAAERNFYRLTGESYQKYIAPPAPARETRPGSGGFGMGFIVREKSKQEITEDMLRRSEALSDWIDRNIQDNDEAISVLDMVLKQMRNKDKLKEPCKIKVKDENIYLKLPKNELKKLSFRRGSIAKMLYVFYLIQLKRAEKDPKAPTRVAQVNLADYKDDLLYIYQGICSRWDAGMHNIESVWDNGSNDFANALSSIRRSFDDIFDVKSIQPKCYSIEIMGNGKLGSLYGIQLDPDDIELGWPYDGMV
ncbi:MAG: hypothetical protein II899_10890 [Bacteroidales bacterium]|nr:hypothetical protein [Bacteroidales bacterium]